MTTRRTSVSITVAISTPLLREKDALRTKKGMATPHTTGKMKWMRTRPTNDPMFQNTLAINAEAASKRMGCFMRAKATKRLNSASRGARAPEQNYCGGWTGGAEGNRLGAPRSHEGASAMAGF